MSKDWTPTFMIVVGGTIASAVVSLAALPIWYAWTTDGTTRTFWLNVGQIAATTAATLVIGGIALFQTLANARLHQEAEARRDVVAQQERDDRRRLQYRDTLERRVGRDWRNWVVSLHVDNKGDRMIPFVRSQFREIGVDYDDFLRLEPELKERIEDHVARGERSA